MTPLQEGHAVSPEAFDEHRKAVYKNYGHTVPNPWRATFVYRHRGTDFSLINDHIQHLPTLVAFEENFKICQNQFHGARSNWGALRSAQSLLRDQEAC